MSGCTDRSCGLRGLAKRLHAVLCRVSFYCLMTFYCSPLSILLKIRLLSLQKQSADAFSFSTLQNIGQQHRRRSSPSDRLPASGKNLMPPAKHCSPANPLVGHHQSPDSEYRKLVLDYRRLLEVFADAVSPLRAGGGGGEKTTPGSRSLPQETETSRLFDELPDDAFRQKLRERRTDLFSRTTSPMPSEVDERIVEVLSRVFQFPSAEYANPGDEFEKDEESCRKGCETTFGCVAYAWTETKTTKRSEETSTERICLGVRGRPPATFVKLLREKLHAGDLLRQHGEQVVEQTSTSSFAVLATEKMKEGPQLVVPGDDSTEMKSSNSKRSSLLQLAQLRTAATATASEKQSFIPNPWQIAQLAAGATLGPAAEAAVVLAHMGVGDPEPAPRPRPAPLPRPTPTTDHRPAPQPPRPTPTGSGGGGTTPEEGLSPGSTPEEVTSAPEQEESVNCESWSRSELHGGGGGVLKTARTTCFGSCMRPYEFSNQEGPAAVLCDAGDTGFHYEVKMADKNTNRTKLCSKLFSWRYVLHALTRSLEVQKQFLKLYEENLSPLFSRRVEGAPAKLSYAHLLQNAVMDTRREDHPDYSWVGRMRKPGFPFDKNDIASCRVEVLPLIMGGSSSHNSRSDGLQRVMDGSEACYAQCACGDERAVALERAKAAADDYTKDLQRMLEAMNAGGDATPGPENPHAGGTEEEEEQSYKLDKTEEGKDTMSAQSLENCCEASS